MALSPTGRYRVNVTGARGLVGPASGPLGSGSVTADTISDSSSEQIAIANKLKVATKSDLKSTMPGKGASMVVLENGENLQDAISALDLEIAAAQAGITIVPDISARDAFYAEEENQGKLVYVNNNNGEPDDPANGVYEYVDGAARLAEAYYSGLAAAIEPILQEMTDLAEEWSTYDLGENINLFNVDDPDYHEGYTLNAATGALSANADFYVTHFIPVDDLENVTREATAASKVFSFYTSVDEGSFLSSVTASAGATSVAVPDDAKWMRASLRLLESPPETLVFAPGTVPPEDYTAWEGRNIQRASFKNQPGGIAGLDDSGKIDIDLLDTRRSDNLFDIDSALADRGLASGTGNVAVNAAFFTTNYIPVRAGEAYSHTPPASGKFYSFYDESQAYISGSQITSTGTFTAPSGAAFVRGSHRYDDDAMDEYQFVHGASLPSEVGPYVGDLIESPINKGQPGGYAGLDQNGLVPATMLPDSSGFPLAGKTIAGLGDSITYGFIPRNAPGYPGQLDSWLPLVGEMLGAEAVLNYGISGSTLADHPTRNPMSQRYDAMSDDADVICLMGGTNDVRNSISLGTMGDTTDATFYGALDVLAQGLLNKYRYDQGTEIGAGKTIVFITPTRLLDTGEPDDLDALLPSFCDAIKEVAAKYAIPVFDAYHDSGLTPELFRTLEGTETGYTDFYNPYVTDGTHPTQEGQQILAASIAGFIRTLL